MTIPQHILGQIEDESVRNALRYQSDVNDTNNIRMSNIENSTGAGVSSVTKGRVSETLDPNIPVGVRPEGDGARNIDDQLRIVRSNNDDQLVGG